jgi:hypothetical protein
MSVRASIACAGPLHIYEQVNEYDDESGYRLCIADMSGQGYAEDDYTGGIIIKRSDLRQVYQELHEYFKQEATWIRTGK